MVLEDLMKYCEFIYGIFVVVGVFVKFGFVMGFVFFDKGLFFLIFFSVIKVIFYIVFRVCFFYFMFILLRFLLLYVESSYGGFVFCDVYLKVKISFFVYRRSLFFCSLIFI